MCGCRSLAQHLGQKVPKEACAGGAGDDTALGDRVGGSLALARQRNDIKSGVPSDSSASCDKGRLRATHHILPQDGRRRRRARQRSLSPFTREANTVPAASPACQQPPRCLGEAIPGSGAGVEQEQRVWPRNSAGAAKGRRRPECPHRALQSVNSFTALRNHRPHLDPSPHTGTLSMRAVPPHVPAVPSSTLPLTDSCVYGFEVCLFYSPLCWEIL